jgi:hypothetical protein
MPTELKIAITAWVLAGVAGAAYVGATGRVERIVWGLMVGSGVVCLAALLVFVWTA